MKRIVRLFPLLSLLVLSLPAFAQTQLITNGGFEFGNDGWFITGVGAGTRANATIPHSGNVNMVMGNVSGTAAQPIVQLVYQYVTIPTNAVDVQLSYWYNIYSTFKNGNQRFAVYVATNSHLAFFVDAHTDLDSDAAQDNAHYHQVVDTHNLAQFAGQTIQIAFNTSMVDFGNLTFFNIDDVSVVAVTTADIAPNDNFANRTPITTVSNYTSAKNLLPPRSRASRTRLAIPAGIRSGGVSCRQRMEPCKPRPLQVLSIPFWRSTPAIPSPT